MDPIPLHLTENIFRRFENVIQASLKSLPNNTSIDPSPLRAITYAARMRDAVLSLRRYNWKTDINIEAWSENDVCVRVEGALVIVGPRQRNKAARSLGSIMPYERQTAMSTIVLEKPIPDNEIAILLSWRDQGVLNAIIVLSQILSDLQKEALNKIFDVGFIQEADKTIIL